MQDAPDTSVTPARWLSRQDMLDLCVGRTLVRAEHKDAIFHMWFSTDKDNLDGDLYFTIEPSIYNGNGNVPEGRIIKEK